MTEAMQDLEAEKLDYGCIDIFIDMFLNASIMEIRSGKVGEPYPKDIELQTRSNEIIEDLPANYPARRLYLNIRDYSIQSMQRQLFSGKDKKRAKTQAMFK